MLYFDFDCDTSVLCGCIWVQLYYFYNFEFILEPAYENWMILKENPKFVIERVFIKGVQLIGNCTKHNDLFDRTQLANVLESSFLSILETNRRGRISLCWRMHLFTEFGKRGRSG